MTQPVGWVARPECETRSVKSLLDDVWQSLKSGDGVRRALAGCNTCYPPLSALLFRAAIRFKFFGSNDVREITRFVSAVYTSLPDVSREQVSPREAGAFIRAELGGEFDLLDDIDLNSFSVYSMVQLVTRRIFEGAAGTPQTGDLVSRN